MEKIPTIFDRDWDGNRGVVPRLMLPVEAFQRAVATEKLDGTNVRLTVRCERLVRVEARRNPRPQEKDLGITEPWYRDATGSTAYVVPDSADKHVVDAAMRTPLEGVPDGEWSAEAIGPKIQGNPLGLDERRVYFFDERIPASLRVPELPDATRMGMSPTFPTWPDVIEWWFNALRDYMVHTKSKVGADVGIEGIVWRGVGKLKLKDYK